MLFNARSVSYLLSLELYNKIPPIKVYSSKYVVKVGDVEAHSIVLHNSSTHIDKLLGIKLDHSRCLHSITKASWRLANGL